MASPDEPAHAAKAAATVRGDFVADESDYNPGRGTFALPDLFQQAWAQACYAFQPDTPASCAAPIAGDLNETVEVASHVARYNPLYYAIIGIPSLFPLSEWTFTAMRLMSAALNAGLVALTFGVLSTLRRRALPTVGVLAAMTPMTFFIGGSMTPQGPEIFGAILVAVSLLSIVFEPHPGLLRVRSWSLVAGAAFFVLARGLSPLYVALIVALVMLAAPRFRVIADVVRDRKFWLPLAACVVLGVTALVYTLASGSLALGIVYPDPTLTARDVVSQMVHNTDYYLEQILGTFGWGDVHLPVWLLVLIGGVSVTIAILGLSFAGWRGRLAVALVLLLSFALPIVVQLGSFHQSGMVWQGKYVLPLAVLAPLLSGFLAARTSVLDRASGAILRVVVVLVGAYQIVALAFNLHRYVNGANGPWVSLIADPWLPLIPIALILAAALASWIITAVLLTRTSRRDAVDAPQPLSAT